MVEISEIGKEFKKCSCSVDSWEVIVVTDDENFDGKSTIYYHCDECGEDFAVLEYETQNILYLNQRFEKNG